MFCCAHDYPAPTVLFTWLSSPYTAGKQKCSGGGRSRTVHKFKCLGCPSHSSWTVNTYRIVSPSFMFCVWCIWHLDAIIEEPWNSNDSFVVFHHVLVTARVCVQHPQYFASVLCSSLAYFHCSVTYRGLQGGFWVLFSLRLMVSWRLQSSFLRDQTDFVEYYALYKAAVTSSVVFILLVYSQLHRAMQMI